VDITQLLAFSVKNKASDLHLSAGLPPMIRVHGDVRRINVEALDHKQVHGMVYDIMNDGQRKHFEEFLEIDFSFEIDGLARFRVNAFNHNRGAGAVFRTIPSKILSLEQLNAPKIFGDLALKPRGMVLVTGPNSGGKTAFCKTITQIQLLSQIGCFVPAQSAKLTVADRIFYQAPEISHLDDGEGRFGTELKRTKNIFLASSAKSLVVLDELSEGTTFEEKMESSSNVLNGFYRKGNSTILITHNHQLVDHFVKQGIGVAKQVEFAHDAPTYKLIPGISRVSHADRVAKKIGFSKEDIDHYLEDSK